MPYISFIWRTLGANCAHIVRSNRLDCGGVEKMRNRNGVSLSEVLLLKVLMGILASIIIPHVSGVGPASRSSTLARHLGKMRSGIDRYERHHNGQLPAARGDDLDSFLLGMMKKTDADGDSGIEFGPYLWRLPDNPFNDLKTVRIDGVVAGANIAGWRFDTRTGAFQADDSPDHAMF